MSSTWRPLRSFRSSAPSGSSSSRTRGRLTRARASATRCCMPPESCAGRRFASAASPTRSSSSRTRRSISPFSTPLRLQPEGDVLLDAQVGEEGVALEDGVGGALVRRDARACRRRRSSGGPSVTSSKPAIIRSVVVLPQPLGPSMVKNSPSAMSRSIASTAVSSPNRLVTELRTTQGPASAARLWRHARTTSTGRSDSWTSLYGVAPMIAPTDGVVAMAADDDHARIVLVAGGDQGVVGMLVDHLDLGVDLGGLRGLHRLAASPSRRTPRRPCAAREPRRRRSRRGRRRRRSRGCLRAPWRSRMPGSAPTSRSRSRRSR